MSAPHRVRHEWRSKQRERKRERGGQCNDSSSLERCWPLESLCLMSRKWPQDTNKPHIAVCCPPLPTCPLLRLIIKTHGQASKLSLCVQCEQNIKKAKAKKIMNSSLHAVEAMILWGREEIYDQDISRWKCLLQYIERREMSLPLQVSLNSSLLISYRNIKLSSTYRNLQKNLCLHDSSISLKLN